MDIVKKIDGIYTEYLHDESLISGFADTISFPQNEQEVVRILKYMNKNAINLTIQGANTGLSGGSVPCGGHIMNMAKMDSITDIRYDKISGEFILSVEPGVVLRDLNQAIRQKSIRIENPGKETAESLDRFYDADSYFFPPDPTETLATIGGMVSCNASGACSFAYGAVRNYIVGIRVVFADGSMGEIQRGKQYSHAREFSTQINGKNLDFYLPDYDFSHIKNAAGYYSNDNMDLIDLFIGSEGTLGVITQIDLRILPAPREKWGLLCLFEQKEHLIEFVFNIKEAWGDHAKLVALEYIDENALMLVETLRQRISSHEALPKIEGSFKGTVYLEIHGENENAMENMVEQIVTILEQSGENIDNTLIACDDAQLNRLKLFRHAVPESANLRMGDYKKNNKGLTAIFTDIAVLEKDLIKTLAMYEEDLKANNLEFIIYGHIGNSHLHVNILPQDMDEYNAGIKLYQKWAQKVGEWGGTISGEHGIGKQKASIARGFFSPSDIEKMRRIKRALDKNGILNRGNIFEL